MKNISKRIMALVLAVAMVFTSLPTFASAETFDSFDNIDESYQLVWGNHDPLKIKDTTGYYSGRRETWNLINSKVSTKIPGQGNAVVEKSFVDGGWFGTDYYVYTGKNIGTVDLVKTVEENKNHGQSGWELVSTKTIHITVVPDIVTYQGQTFELKDKDGDTDKMKDVKGDGYNHQVFTTSHQAQYAVASFEVDKNAVPGYYVIKTNNYDWLIKVGNESEMPDYNTYNKKVILNVAEGMPAALITGKGGLTQINKNDAISNNFADYRSNFKETYTDEEAGYTYTLIGGTVTVASKFDMNDTTKVGVKDVNVTANYRKERIQPTTYVIKLEANIKGATFDQAKNTSYTLGKNTVDKDVTLSRNVADYIKVSFTSEDKHTIYTLGQNASVTVGPEFVMNNETKEGVKDVTINAEYVSSDAEHLHISYVCGNEVLNDNHDLYACDYDFTEYEDDDYIKEFAPEDPQGYKLQGVVVNGNDITFEYSKKVEWKLKFADMDDITSRDNAIKYVDIYEDEIPADRDELKSEETLAKYGIEGYNGVNILTNPMWGNTIVIDCQKKTFTVSYVDADTKTEFYKETVKYNEDAKKANDAKAAYEKEHPEKQWNGWVVDGEQDAKDALKNIKSNVTVYTNAGNKEKISIKHIMEYYDELRKEIKETVVYVVTKGNNNYLDKILPEYKNGKEYYAPKTQDQFAGYDNNDEDNKIGLRYWANKYTVQKGWYEANGKWHVVEQYTDIYPTNDLALAEIKNDQNKYRTSQDYKEKALKAGILTEDDFKLVGGDHTEYTYNNTWFEVKTSKNKKGNEFTDILFIVPFDKNEDKMTYTFKYVAKDAYGVEYVVDDTKTKEVKGEEISTWEKSDDFNRTIEANMPKGYELDKQIPVKVEDGIITINVTVKGRKVFGKTNYYVEKFWKLGIKNGEYYRVDSENHDTDWVNLGNKDIVTVNDTIIKHPEVNYTYEASTFTNENVSWTNKVMDVFGVYGFYDNDDVKDGVVKTNYFIKNAEGEYELYAEDVENKFYVTENKNAQIEEFEEYPNEDETNIMIWKEIKLEDNTYNVYGLRTNTQRVPDAKEIKFDFNLPLGLSNASMETVIKYSLVEISEKAAAEIDKIEGKLIEEDEANGMSVIKIEADEVYDYLKVGTVNEEKVLSSEADAIVSNYYNYTIVVNLIERSLTGEKFTQNNWTKGQVETQAINNAIDAIKSNSEFSELVFDKETAVVTGMSEDWAEYATVPAGDYELVVRISTISDSNPVEFEVKVPFTATNNSGRSRSKKTKIEDPLVAQGSELLNDLRTIRPNDLITRAEFVGVLANLFQVPEDRIYDKAWNLEGCEQRAQIEKYATYIIVKGYSDEEFGQNDTITAEQVYTILARALKFQAKVKAMTDDEIKAELAKVQNADKVSDWAQEGVSIALKVGIAAATETVPTEPQNGVMRMTAADTLQKYLEVVAAPAGETEVKVVEE